MTGIELKSARKQLGYSQKALALKLSVHPGTVARWEMQSGQWPIPGYVELLTDLWLTDHRTQAEGLDRGDGKE